MAPLALKAGTKSTVYDEIGISADDAAGNGAVKVIEYSELEQRVADLEANS